MRKKDTVMGRKRLNIDLKEVVRLAGRSLTEEEISEAMEISPITLDRCKAKGGDGEVTRFVQGMFSGFARRKSKKTGASL